VFRKAYNTSRKSSNSIRFRQPIAYLKNSRLRFWPSDVRSVRFAQPFATHISSSFLPVLYPTLCNTGHGSVSHIMCHAVHGWYWIPNGYDLRQNAMVTYESVLCKWGTRKERFLDWYCYSVTTEDEWEVVQIGATSTIPVGCHLVIIISDSGLVTVILTYPHEYNSLLMD